MIVPGPTTPASDLQNGGRKARRLSSLAVVNLHCQGLSISVASEMIMSPVYYGDEQSLEFGSGRNRLQSYLSGIRDPAPGCYREFGTELKLTRCCLCNAPAKVEQERVASGYETQAAVSQANGMAILLSSLVWAVFKRTSSA
ncbi:unnamed protein product [Fusarium graminearum]|uniref:Chromosome 2, complete genome n=1 Tax=Gibberella zeae (strain ATCC MYA-4620 / CBS 123657 / FGSC 9075 / NRRL 31084 / PH-1) TaxID=229533 RepID=I1S628_GIBZE|nr:hypothetical protein FGSG_12299 [Fusarium graminearum PH-1]ESU09001.1 hypothetical protein FGSG_12299 [Fusarium graminearum PH-1]CEF79086.1 unnamed protein product [Fusarium graminearum]CZS82371.1 unnamed protein product [Fusarium graminearum]|eukprot:XP_011321500.1 hypothetical protein FGSG_12299 [Fusarium graminearum PH-1]